MLDKFWVFGCFWKVILDESCFSVSMSTSENPPRVQVFGEFPVEQWTNAFWTCLGSTAAGDLPVTCTCDPPAFAQPPRLPWHRPDLLRGSGWTHGGHMVDTRFVDKAGWSRLKMLKVVKSSSGSSIGHLGNALIDGNPDYYVIGMSSVFDLPKVRSCQVSCFRVLIF